MEERVLIGLVPGLGPAVAQGLLGRFPGEGEILRAAPRDLERAGVPPAASQALVEARAAGRHVAELERARSLGITLLAPDDADYPEGLAVLEPAAPLLYVKGSIVPGDRAAVAVIGARRSSPYGRAHAARLSEDLAEAGVTVVSGMARGIDASSHRGALRGGGRTLAVLGSGINVVYPREHRDLYRRIHEHGAVLSEFPLDTPPCRRHFPQRNRIISGLSLGVVVVEATLRSGTLITVEWALDQGRDVFAVPGGVDSPLSRGTHRLIREGAKLVEEVDDILEELKGMDAMKNLRKDSPSRKVPPARLGPRESRLLSLLSTTPIPLDELVDRVGYPVSVVSALLTLLEMKELVRPLPGSRFVLSGAGCRKAMGDRRA